MLEFQEWIVTRNAHAEGIPLGDFRGWIIRGRKMDTKCLGPVRGFVWIDMWPQKAFAPAGVSYGKICGPPKAFAPAGVSFG